MRVLPPLFSQAIATMHWSLDPAASPPLYFQSLSEMKVLRLTDLNQDSNVELESLLGEQRDIPETLQQMFGNSDNNNGSDSSSYYYGWISMALILLGHGWTDECHNLVTPLSWPEDVHFAHGPSLYAKVDPGVRTMASYVHSLVHRREAFHVGEFGMVGFANANYWGNAFAKSPVASQAVPHAALRKAVQGVVAQYNNQPQQNPLIQEWCQQHDVLVSPDKEEETTFWDPRAVHALCATALQLQNQSSSSPSVSDNHERFTKFAERVATEEMLVLLEHALRKAGYAMPDATSNGINKGTISTSLEISATQDKDTTPTTTVGADVATRAVRRISSAHLERFVTSGSVVLRRMADQEDNRLVAAGVACCLLQAPACREVANDHEMPIGPFVVVGIATTTTLGGSGGGELARGDVWVQVCQNSDETTSMANMDGLQVYFFTATEAEDSLADYVDPFFGTRGETPTTVIQWSKGTIF